MEPTANRLNLHKEVLGESPYGSWSTTYGNKD